MNSAFVSRLAVCVFAALAGFSVYSAEQTPLPDLGPTFSGTIRAKYPAGNTTMKGVVVTLDKEKKAYICFDTDLMRMSLGWTGDFLRFGNYQREVVHPQPPEVAGKVTFGCKPGPGWSRNGSFADARPNAQGPLPREHVKYRGLYMNGDRVIFSYTIAKVAVLEEPRFEAREGADIFTRTIQLDKGCDESILICDLPPDAKGEFVSPNLFFSESDAMAIAVAGAANAKLELSEHSLQLKLSGTEKTFQILLGVGSNALVQLNQKHQAQPPDLALLTKGGPARWKDPVITKGTLGADNAPYVADTITEPTPNPWNAKTFFGGFDFLPDGRAAVCTFHGDVWLVSGIDEKLDKLSWKRFATGMFQALGLKVVGEKIYVTCRDQITRLHDLNNDGEADFYENFNNDIVVTANYHEFALDLHTDSKGSFYFAKGSPWPPDVKSPHQGCLLKVSKDGSTMEVFATGLRAPNGMGLGPHDEITVSDNQGHWMPASKLNWVKQGGFYGMTPASHRSSRPADFDKPICWLPMNADNSSGGQTWVTSDRWGPLKDHLLFQSYGKGTLFVVMHEEVDGHIQAAMAQFPLKFNTGIMRARFNPKDGQLYMCGLRGWQTSGVRDGGFYRVRYTGQPVHMASEFHAVKNGLKITFTSALDEASATSVQNYSAEAWNYKWSADYGSPEFSPNDPEKKTHDPVAIKTVQLSSDKRTIFLEIPDLKPVNQLKVKLKISAADASPVSQEIFSTIHRLGHEQKLSKLN